MEFEILEIADATVHESARSGGGACSEILAIHDHGGETPYLSFSSDGETVHAAAYYEKVESLYIGAIDFLTIMRTFTYVIHVP